MDAVNGLDLARYLAAARARLTGRHLSAANARRVLAVTMDARGARRSTAGQKARAIELAASGARRSKRDVATR
jgi:hypothetical protein